MKLKRCENNPILKSDPTKFWEAEAVFNPCATRYKKDILMLYRSAINIQRNPGDVVNISSIGVAKSKDGVHFGERRLFFGPEYVYETYGCEDPRVTKFSDQYYIFYTAVSEMPATPRNVKLALATTKDFKKVEKHGLICPVNSKAGFLFPKKIGGQMTMLLTLYPDAPPAKLLVVYFNKIEELFEKGFWNEYLDYSFKERIIKFNPRREFVEVGSPPIETKEGWLIFLPDIIFEHGEFLEFRISAALLDLDNPTKLLAITRKPLLVPEIVYETRRLFNPRYITMPTGALLYEGKIYVYYGASDMFCCMASCDKKELVDYLIKECRV